MHFHLHIKECVENYGSMYGFWLFSFERYDGILGSFHAANNREVEVQPMRRFLTMSALDGLKYLMPPEFFHPLCSEIHQANDTDGVVEHPTINSLPWLKVVGGLLIPNCTAWTDRSVIQLPTRYRLCCFDGDEIGLLRTTYARLYPSLELSTEHLNSTFRKYSSLCIDEERLSSGMENRLYKYVRVMASWVGGEGQIALGQSIPGRVKYYFEYSFEIDEQQYRYCFACVQWYKEYANNVSFRNPALCVLCQSFFTNRCCNIYSVQRIQSRFITMNTKHENVDVITVCPLQTTFIRSISPFFFLELQVGNMN